MLLSFGDCEMDLGLFALRRGGRAQSVEPLVFNLLAYLVHDRDRVVGRGELQQALWGGRVVDDSTLRSCIKAARHAVGDDGRAQACIATVHRRGWRFVAPVSVTEAQRPPSATAAPAARPLAQPPSARAREDAGPQPGMDRELGPELQVSLNGRVEASLEAGRRARIAVMPFTDLASAGASGDHGASDGHGASPGPAHSIARALAHDIISGLARLRSLFVIAQGSVFALAARSLAPQEAAQALQVDYLVSGTLLCRGEGLEVAVELAQARDQRIVWAQAFEQPRAQALQVRDLVAERIVACVAAEVEVAERNRALLKPPQSLDAWEAYHRGLWHMYLFNREDNQQARRLFGQAVQADPGFAPAYAGLSFTHFQEAFQGWGPRAQQAGLAFERAGQSLVADERNPVAHWAMGRALWLRGQQAQSVRSLEQAVALSPSFALGHYTLAFVHAQAGDPRQALASSHEARELSPFDPLLFGMLGARAMALVRSGRHDEAATCAVEAAAQPNAHAHILGLASLSLALAGSLEAARAQAAALRQRSPRYGIDDFLAAFRFDADGERLFREGARRIGLG